MLNGKAMIIVLTIGLIKKIKYKLVNTFQYRNLLEQMRKLN